MSMIPPISSNSVFVVSGGGRGITAKCISTLAQQYPATFLLLGRTPLTEEPAWANGLPDEAALKQHCFAHLQAQGVKPTPRKVSQEVSKVLAGREINQTLQALMQAGGQGEYLSADVTDVEAVRTALATVTQRTGPITGIIHGAGNLADKLIEQKTLEDFDLVFNAKIKGLENLLTCIPLAQLQHLILFSSAAGFYGNAGQTDYALANEILNKFAHLVKHLHPTCHVIAFDWGPWDGGMVTPALRQHFASQNISVIPLEAGAQVFASEVARYAAVQVVVGSPMGPIAPKKLEPTLRSYRIRRKLVAEDNPFLEDHVIGENKVLPAVFAITWMINACEQLYPGYTFASYEHFKVLKGIIFDATLASEYILDLKELRKTEEGIDFEAIVWSLTPQGKPRYHYSQQVNLLRTIPEAPIYRGFDLSETHVIPGSQLYRDGTLFHGPRFQGVERVLNLSQERLTMQYMPPTTITASDYGQFPCQTLNPLLADIEFQSILILVKHIHQSGSLPLSARKAQYFKRLAPDERCFVSVEAKVNTPMKLLADVFMHTDKGRVYAHVTDAEVAVSQNLNNIFAKSIQR